MLSGMDEQPESGGGPPHAEEGGRRRRGTKGVTRGRLKVHDPFELVRWLALSQPDPRKALAELVQNSLDAGARSIRVLRQTKRGTPCLTIWDDGEGVIPELDRPEALKYIATHIGHSRKRTLTPQQRLELMTQGQYGIGLLGFWSLGEMLEIRTAMPGQKPFRLVLYRDRPQYKIEPLRGKLAFEDRFTEVVVVGLAKEASTAVGARRAADYLASELRGQLLMRPVEVGFARGRNSLRTREGARHRKRSLGGGARRGGGDPSLERERGDPRARARRRPRCFVALPPSPGAMAGQ
jgi:hypothetical protein